MPLRDALRGVASISHAGEDMLEPAVQLLPEPLRARFSEALDRLDSVGMGIVHPPIDLGSIERASGFLTGIDTEKGDLQSCVQVVVYAWECLAEAGSLTRFLISETIVADVFAKAHAGCDATGALHAATLLHALRFSSAIGTMPGLSRGLSTANERAVGRALLSIGLWLLTARAATLEEELKLIDLASALVAALSDDANDIFADVPELARFLSDTQRHL